MLDMYNRDYHNFSLQTAIYRTTRADIPTVYIDQFFLVLTPDTMLKSKVCPDVLLASSRRKSCRGLSRLFVNNLTQERQFLPVLKNWVSLPSSR